LNKTVHRVSRGYRVDESVVRELLNHGLGLTARRSQAVLDTPLRALLHFRPHLLHAHVRQAPYAKSGTASPALVRFTHKRRRETHDASRN
jgi:hypothetical protein